MYCLITGASYGVGEALVKEMLKRGYKVIGIARSIDKMNDMKKHLGADFYPIQCDLEKKSSIKKVSDRLLKENIIPKIFILNGAQLIKEEKFNFENYKKLLDINYFGVLYWIDYWVEHVQKNGGGTFSVSGSISSIFTKPKLAAYAATKIALRRLFDGLNVKYYGTNIKFTHNYISTVRTRMIDLVRAGASNMKWLGKSPQQAALLIAQNTLNPKPRFHLSYGWSFLHKMLKFFPKKLFVKIVSKVY